jgi:hypothetical protein
LAGGASTHWLSSLQAAVELVDVVPPPEPVDVVAPPEPAVPPEPVDVLAPPEPAVPPEPVDVLAPPEPPVPPEPVDVVAPPEPPVPPEPVDVVPPWPPEPPVAEEVEVVHDEVAPPPAPVANGCVVWNSSPAQAASPRRGTDAKRRALSLIGTSQERKRPHTR